MSSSQAAVLGLCAVVCVSERRRALKYSSFYLKLRRLKPPNSTVGWWRCCRFKETAVCPQDYPKTVLGKGDNGSC